MTTTDRVWRWSAVLLALAGGVCCALACWSAGSPGLTLPAAPLLCGGSAGLMLGFFCSLGGWESEEYFPRVAVTLVLTGLLCAGAAAADEAYATADGWRQTRLPVTATLSDCRVDARHGDGDSGYTELDSCVYHWTYRGDSHSKRRSAPGADFDGRHLQVWLDPDTGEVADHSMTDVVLWSLLALVTAGPAVAGVWICAAELLSTPDLDG